MSLYELRVIEGRRETKIIPSRDGNEQTPFWIEGHDQRNAWEIVHRLREWANEGIKNPELRGETVVYQPLKRWQDLGPHCLPTLQLAPKVLWPIKPELAKTVYGDPYALMRASFLSLRAIDVVPFFGALARDPRANVAYTNGSYTVWIDLQAESSFRVTLDLSVQMSRVRTLFDGRFQVIAYPIDPQ